MTYVVTTPSGPPSERRAHTASRRPRRRLSSTGRRWLRLGSGGPRAEEEEGRIWGMCWRWAQVAVLQTAAGEGNEESGKSVRFSARARSDCWDFSRDGFGVAGVHEPSFGPARRFSLFFFFIITLVRK